ncbi:hypothetical protein N9I68_04115, partial [Bacteroidia bacterium]|nr:hypothetical protein [Bacteroidia bacterium]
SSSFAQRLLVQYDFQKDNFTYYNVGRNGIKKEINRPVVTKNHNVKVEVINFNPFIYTAVSSYSSEKFEENANFNFMNLISPLGLPMGGSNFLSELTSAESSRGGLFSDPKTVQALNKVQATYQTLYKAEQMSNTIDFVLYKVNSLKYNSYLPGDSIKSFASGLVTDLLGQNNVSSQDFMVIASDINNVVNSETAKLNSYTQNFKSAYQNFADTRGKGGGFEGEGYDAVVQEWSDDASSFAESFSSKKLLDKLNLLEMEYQSIMNTPFSFNTSEIAKDDQITITLDVYKNPEEGSKYESADIANLSGLKKVKTKDIEITVKGDLKINSSVGLAFPAYGNNNEFINKDSLITSISGNNFTPNIAAYLNFYPYTGRNVSIGGTFGVGVPISIDNKNFNFLLGGSALFGSENRLVLHYGATLGQVNALDKGFAVGDKLTDEAAEVPVRKSYQWGGFVGVSFSLAKVSK